MSSQNIYGVDIAIGPTGDLIVNSAGDIATVGNVQVVAQALQLRLRTALGDLPLHPEYGTSLPTGAKMDPIAVAAAVNGELAVTVKDDPRLRSATVTGVEWPASGDPTALSLTVNVVLAGGEEFEVAGLPSEARIGEVTPGSNVEGESGLSAFEEQPYFADEQTTAQIEGESEIESLVNDLPGS
jgi:phage baseplate assembly protein W